MSDAMDPEICQPEVSESGPKVELKPNPVFVGENADHRIVIPGDLIEEIPVEKNVILGPGLTRDGVDVFACKSGLLRSKNIKAQNPVYWVDTHQRRYVAAKGEHVIGTVIAKAGDTFRVDIGIIKFSIERFRDQFSAKVRLMCCTIIGGNIQC